MDGNIKLIDEIRELRTVLRAAVDDLVERGHHKSSIGSAMIGLGAGLVHVHSSNPDAIDLAIQGIRDAVDADGQAMQ